MAWRRSRVRAPLAPFSGRQTNHSSRRPDVVFAGHEADLAPAVARLQLPGLTAPSAGRARVHRRCPRTRRIPAPYRSPRRRSRLKDRGLEADVVSKCPVLVGACVALSSRSSFLAALADAALACRSGRLPAPSKDQFDPPQLPKRQPSPLRRRGPAHVGSRRPRSTSRVANGRPPRRS